MSNLADLIDRLSSTMKSIRSTAAEISNPYIDSEGPFTRAVLHTSLGDLIREVDSSELGLFTLVAPTAVPHQEKLKDEIARVEFPGATPLKRSAAARRDDALRIKELEPEVYAQAALKYLDRYQSIRPMPRARSQVVTIIHQLAATRSRVQSFNETFAEKYQSHPVPSSPKSLVNAEEKRIQGLQAQIAQLKKRKGALSEPKPHPKITHTKPSTKPPKDILSPPSTPRTPIAPALADEASQSQDSEAAFWQTPAAAPDRVLHFTDTMLMDEQPNLGDISVSISSIEIDSSVKEGTGSAESSFDAGLGGGESLDDDIDAASEAKTDNEDDTSLGIDKSFEYEEECDEGEKTVVMKHAPPVSSPEEPQPPAPIIDKPPLSARSTQFNIKVNSEIERIVSKIWPTVGEIIMPGHPFDASGKGSSMPLRAKETVAHLQFVSSQRPSPASPSAASLSSISAAPNPPSGHPTTQQILTAHLLLALLSSPPNFCMPLNKLKEELSNKVNGDCTAPTNLLGGQATTRALYVCVAKKLVKIERGGGEQVVKFDV